MPALSDIDFDAIRRHRAIPADTASVFVSGSLVVDWGHATSDVDIYVIADAEPPVEPEIVFTTTLDPAGVPCVVEFVEGRRWDVEYWRPVQVDQLLERVSAADLPRADSILNPTEADFLYRLSIGVAVQGQEWLEGRQERVRASRIRTIFAAAAFEDADGYVDDASGMLQSGDLESGVLAARAAFGAAVDGALYAEGQLARNPKWRARKVRRAAAAFLPWELYWETETMRDFDAADPGAWITSTLELCQRLMMEVDVS